MDIDLTQYATLGIVVDLEWPGLVRADLMKAIGPWGIALEIAERCEKRFMLIAGSFEDQWPLAGGCNDEDDVVVAMCWMHQQVGARSLPGGGITPWVLLVEDGFQKRLQATLGDVKLH
jgi:hypothetical protein